MNVNVSLVFSHVFDRRVYIYTIGLCPLIQTYCFQCNRFSSFTFYYIFFSSIHIVCDLICKFDSIHFVQCVIVIEKFHFHIYFAVSIMSIMPACVCVHHSQMEWCQRYLRSIVSLFVSLYPLAFCMKRQVHCLNRSMIPILSTLFIFSLPSSQWLSNVIQMHFDAFLTFYKYYSVYAHIFLHTYFFNIQIV